MKLPESLKSNLSLDLRSLALMRILTGTALLINLIGRGLNLSQFYTDSGVLPRQVLFEGAPQFITFHALSGSLVFELILLLVAIIFSVFLILGYRTRLASIISWILFISLQNRNPLVVYGVDDIMSIGLFWGMFLPWGMRFSIYSLRKGLKKQNNQVFTFATVIFLLQISLLYFLNGAMKGQSMDWNQGNALLYILQDPYTRTKIGESLLKIPEALRVMSHGTIVLENIAPILLFLSPELRLLALVLLTFFHTGIAATMGLYLFSFTTIALLSGLLPPFVWNALKPAKNVKQPFLKEKDSPINFKNVVLVVVILYVVFVTKYGLSSSKDFFPQQILRIGSYLRLHPTHGYYATPLRGVYSASIMGVFNNGKQVLLTDTARNGDKPFFVKGFYDQRWKVYLIRLMLEKQRYQKEIDAFVSHICTQTDHVYKKIEISFRSDSISDPKTRPSIIYKRNFNCR